MLEEGGGGEEGEEKEEEEEGQGGMGKEQEEEKVVEEEFPPFLMTDLSLSALFQYMKVNFMILSFFSPDGPQHCLKFNRIEAFREWTTGKGGRRRPILKNEGKR